MSKKKKGHRPLDRAAERQHWKNLIVNQNKRKKNQIKQRRIRRSR